ncbi:hypothetical protein RQP46_006193 [Phenoliferia psychrophenolica]
MGADGDDDNDAGKITITVKFPGSGAEEISIKCKKTTPFSKIYNAVAKQRSISADSFVLQWDEQRLGKDETPKMHEFGEVSFTEEQLDFFASQVGGSRTE